MKKPIVNTDHPIENENSLPNASLNIYDLPVLIEKMKHEGTWTEAGLNAMILFKSLETQIVLTSLQKGAEIKSFQSNDSITFQVIEGKLKFYIPKKSVTIAQGQLLEFHENVKYRLKSEDATVFLLTISNKRLHTDEEEIFWCL